MASSKLCGGGLPLDAVYEILLRVPGRDLCRLRAVCRPWRSLLSDPAFAAAYAARHAEPLFVASYSTDTSNNGVLYNIVDLSGRVVRRFRAPAPAPGETTTSPMVHEWVASTGLGLVCVAEGAGVRCRLLDPSAAAAGAAARALPRGQAEEHAAYEQEINNHTATVALGRVASTGERKVLRVLHLFPDMSRQLYEIITLDGGGDCGRWWRKTMDPAHIVGFGRIGTWAAIDTDGVVYFFSSEFVLDQGVMPDRIASFDLETEQRRPTIRGLVSSTSSLADDVGVHPITNHLDWGEFSLAAMNGSLVMTHRVLPSSTMDLWFLMDAEKGLWVKKHVLQLSISYRVRPLQVLDDGTIVLVHFANRGSLKIYDPRTSSSTDVAGLDLVQQLVCTMEAS